MRFPCVCVAALSGLLAVRCAVFTPLPMEAAINVLRWVLASDREWQVILSQSMKPGTVDADGMLASLGLTPNPDTGIMPYQIVQRLVTNRAATGTQLMYGIRVLGLALEVQFAKSLSAHMLLTLKFTTNSDTMPSSVRHCIWRVQTSLVVFADKVAFFGYPIDFFLELNDLINEFLEKQKIALAREDEMSIATRGIIQDFLTQFISRTKSKVASGEFDEKMVDENILKVLHLNDDKFSMDTMDSHHQFATINKIDYYEQVNVRSFGLEFGEKVFKIIDYADEEEQKKPDE